MQLSRQVPLALATLSLALATLPLALATLLLAGQAAAQVTGAPPGILTPYAKDTVFTSQNLQNLKVIDSNGSNKTLIQISMTKVPGVDGVGQWTTCLTCYDISATYGGALGGQYVVMGQYDINGTTPTFTPNTLANAMNNTSNASIFGLMLEPKLGLIAMVDQRNGIYLANRTSTTGAFNTPVMVVPGTGAPAFPGTYIDPAPAYVDGKLVVFYVNGTALTIEMRELTLTTTAGVVTKAEAGVPTTVTQTGVRTHSPTPIVDATGEARGLWLSANTGSDSDMYFQPGLTTKDTPLQVFDNINWMNNGAIIGGKVFFANNENSLEISVADISWMVGSNTRLGSTATLTVGGGNPTQSTPIVQTAVGLSARLPGTAAPVTIPGWNGQYGLASVDLLLARLASVNKDNIASWSAPVPNITALQGLRVSVQGLSAATGSPATFTNTATLEFK